jgi:uncharacterized protein (DUF697 family)/ethanolamine utilization protein EutP (predicted NTPase)
MSIDVFGSIRDWAPKDLLSLLDQIVYFFPIETRLSLRKVVESLPKSEDNLVRIYQLVRRQWDDLGSDPHLKIALVGPAQTGKSSLLHSFAKHQEDPEAVSFEIVDLAGLEEYLGYRSESLPEELAGVDLVLLVLDAQYGLTEATAGMHRRLTLLPAQVVVVLNKIDLVEAPGEAVRDARRILRTSIIPISTLETARVHYLLKAIVTVYTRALYPLAKAFPRLRRPLCASIVQQAAFAATISGALRTPFPQLLPVAAIHCGMILKVARAFGFPLSLQRARELVPVFGLDLALDRGIDHLQSRFPGRRSVVSSSAYGLYTWALGQVAILYFEKVADFLSSRARVLPGPGNDRFSWNKS